MKKGLKLGMPGAMPWLKVFQKSYGGWSIEAGTGRG